MKKILSENLLLKVVAAAAAVIMWFVVINIENPTDTFIITNIPITVLNESALTDQGLTYELPEDATVSIEVTTRRTDKKKISADDFEATINLKEIYSATGSVAVNVSAVENKSLIRSMTQITRSLVITVEEIQTMDYDIEVRQSGTPSDSVTYQSASVDPSIVTVTAPETVIRQISYAAVTVNVDGKSDDIDSTEDVVLYNVYGEAMSDLDPERVSVSVSEAEVKLTATQTNKINVDVSVTGQDAVADGYKFITYTCEPQTVEVTGAKTLVADFDKIQIEEDISGASGDFSKDYEISDYLPDGLEVADGQSKVITISYQVDPISSKDFQIAFDNIELVDGKDGFSFSFGQAENLTVTLSGLEEDLAKVKKSDIHVAIDLSGITETGSYSLIPEVTMSGSYASYFDIGVDRVIVTAEIKTSQESSSEGEEEKASSDAAAE